MFRTVLEFFKPTYKTVFIIDPPELLEKNNIYILGTKEYPWQIIFICPCGCEKKIQLNLLRESSPCWRYKLHRRKKISLFPSVWRTVGCKSHFCIRSGKVKWVKF